MTDDERDAVLARIRDRAMLLARNARTRSHAHDRYVDATTNATDDAMDDAKLTLLASYADYLVAMVPTTPVPPSSAPGSRAAIACPRCKATVTVSLA